MKYARKTSATLKMNCALLQKGSREENLWKCGWPKRVGWEVNVKNAKTKNVAQGFSEMWNLQHILKECRCYELLIK